jgi:predicted RNA-binding protein with PIN domain
MYFVDGNNVMANRLEIDLGMRLAEEYLVTAIARWADRTGHRVLLAFDGHPKTSPDSASSLVKIMRPSDVSGAHTADDVLLEMIKQSHGAQTSVLVTNDTELQKAARGLGVRTIMDSQEFLEMVREVGDETNEAARLAGAGDKETWERVFGVDMQPPTQTAAKEPDGDAWAEYLANQDVKPLTKQRK